MRRGPLVATLVMLVGGVCFQVRGSSNKVLTDPMSAGYPTGNSVGKSIEGLIGIGTRPGNPPGSPFLVSQAEGAHPIDRTHRRRHWVTLSWNPSVPTSISSENLISGYNVYRRSEIRTMSTRYIRINSDLVTDTSYMDDSVRAGLLYDYETTAVDFRGMESAPSNRIRIRIPYP